MDRFFTTFKTAGQGLANQRKQVQLASENMANAQTTRTASGGPYRPKNLQLIQRSEEQFKATFLNTVLKMRNSNDNHSQGADSLQHDVGTSNLGPQAMVVEESRYRYEYDPGHPDADENGMVQYPDVDMVEEMTRLVSANRLYEANLSVIEAEKEIIKRSFEI